MTGDESTPLLPAMTIEATNYISAIRAMNLHDFIEPEEGGYRLVNNLDSARQELQQFMDDRDLRLAEPFEVRITVEVTARTEPKPQPQPPAILGYMVGLGDNSNRTDPAPPTFGRPENVIEPKPQEN